MTEAEQVEALENVKRKQSEFRKALDDYQKLTGSRAPILFDGRPKAIHATLLESCRVFPEREAMMSALASGKVGAEVGVQRGKFSRFLLDTLEFETLHLFDRNTTMIPSDVIADPRVILHAGDSSTHLSLLPDACLDWCYIDADHSYKGALKDARAALPKMKKGSFIAFNDYTPWSAPEVIPYGVMSVVNTLANEGHKVLGLALNPWGYFDIAISV